VAIAERRQVTTLFCDLVGYTKLSSDFDPEIVLELLTSYKDICATLIESYGGHVLRYVGDGVLATFGYPRSREDDAARAVATGLVLAEQIGKLVTPKGDRLEVRIGIATGLVVAGDMVGDAAVEKHSLVGEAPNLAARLQGEASAGEVLIAEATARIIGGQFRLESLATRNLKGYDAPVTAYRVLGEQRGATRFEAVHGGASTLPMISREHEIALDEHAEIAVQRLSGMQEERGCAGGGERSGDLLGNDAALTHAGDDDAAAGLTAAQHQIHCRTEGRGHSAFEARCECDQAFRLRADEVCRCGACGIGWACHAECVMRCTR